MISSASKSRHYAAHGGLSAAPGFFTMLALWQSRRALSQLDETALEDIGLDPHAAAKEAKRPFWDIPRNWRR